MKPLSLTHALKLPITSGVALIAIGVSIAYWLGWDISSLTERPSAQLHQPWRFVTSIFPHVDLLHLIYNVYWLWVFGSRLEQIFGHTRFALLVLMFAVGSACPEFALLDGGVGLSGVVYGFFGMCWVLSAKDERFAGMCDSRTVLTFVGWFFLCIALSVTGTMAVANIAHGAGAILGLGIAGVITTKGVPRRVWIGGIVLFLVASFTAATYLRPEVNISKHGGLPDAYDGWAALNVQNDAEGLRLLTRATRYRYTEGEWWYNLGVAQYRFGRWADSVASIERAHALVPGNQDWTKMLKEMKQYVASLDVQASAATTATRPN